MFLKKMLQKIKQERGALMVLTAVLLPVMLGFAGLAVDVGNLYVHQTRLQNTADAAVLAGGRAYLNNLARMKVNAADKSVTLSTDEVMEARVKLVSVADEHIVKNNPLFNEKLGAGQGNNSKSYAIGKKTNTEDSSKSTEYFRVTLTETVPVYFLPVLGIQNVADVSVYATAKITDTEVITVEHKPSSSSSDGQAEYNPLVIAGNSFENQHWNNEKKANIYNMKLYVTNQENKENNVIEAKKIGDKYYVRSNGGGGGTTYYEIDETRAYDMNRFGEEIKKLFRQLREERAPGSVDEYYMTYYGSSGNIAHGIAEISKQPENYGLKQGEHSYLYLSYSKMDGGHEEGEVLEIGSLKIQDLYTGGNITEDTPYYLFIDEDIKIQNVFIEASCTRPLVFCYFRKAEGEQITYHFHNKTTVIKGILYAPNVKSWVQINNGNYFSGSIVGDKIAIQSQKNSIFEYNVSEVEKWKQGEDGLKFLPEIGFQDSSAPDSGSSSGSGGSMVVKEEITLPEGHLNLVLEGSQTDASYYKDSEIDWDDLN